MKADMESIYCSVEQKWSHILETEIKFQKINYKEVIRYPALNGIRMLLKYTNM